MNSYLCVWILTHSFCLLVLNVKNKNAVDAAIHEVHCNDSTEPNVKPRRHIEGDVNKKYSS